MDNKFFFFQSYESKSILKGKNHVVMKGIILYEDNYKFETLYYQFETMFCEKKKSITSWK